jgi:hypothetical protein
MNGLCPCVVRRFAGLQASSGGGALGFIHGWTAMTADLCCFSDPANNVQYPGIPLSDWDTYDRAKVQRWFKFKDFLC